MPGSNGNGLRPEEEHVLGMSNTEDVSSVNDGKKSITAWLGLASAIGGIGANLWMNERNNRYNREQHEQAYQQNLQMWNLQNAYNLPANQIARLKQAGLNPNLIYGNPDNTAGAPPEKEPAKGERGELDPMAIANALLMQKQMEQVDSQIELNTAQSNDLNADAKLKEQKVKTEEQSTLKEAELYRLIKGQADEQEKIVNNFQIQFDKQMKKLDETINLLKNQNKTEEQEYRKLFNENNWFAQTWSDRRNILREELKRAGLLNQETAKNIDYIFSLTVGNRFANKLQQMLFEKSNDFALYGNRMSYYDLYVYSMGKNLWRQEEMSKDAFGRYENYEKKTLENRAWFDSTGYGTFLYGAGQTLDAFNVSFGITPFGMNLGSPVKIKGFGR